MIPIVLPPAPEQATPPPVAQATQASLGALSAPGQGSATPPPPVARIPVPQAAAAAASSVPPAAPERPDIGETSEVTRAAQTSPMSFPVQGSIIRPYAPGENEGIDIKAGAGAPVKAAADGVVAAITKDADDVPILVMRHNETFLTVYSNITGVAVAEGDVLRRGQTFARLGRDDDAYLHFEVRNGFESVDPTKYLP